jgi:hypothetical protein
MAAMALLTGAAEAVVTVERATAKSIGNCVGIEGCGADIVDQSGAIVATVETEQDGTTVTVSYDATPKYITKIFLLAKDSSSTEVYSSFEELAEPVQTAVLSFDVAGLSPGECLSFETYIEFQATGDDPTFNLDDLAGLLLPDEVTMQVEYAGSSGNPSYFDTTVSNGGILDGTYDGWCVDTSRGITSGQTFTAEVYSSYESLPAGIVDFPLNLDLVNWIINQNYPGTASPGGFGTYSFSDVQRAIWQLIDDTQSDAGLIDWNENRVQEILDAADAAGEGFLPQCGQTVAVILVPTNQDGVAQQVIIAQVTLIDLPLGCNVQEISARISFCCCLDSQTIELQKVWVGTAGETTLSITDAAGASVATADAFGQNATTGSIVVIPGAYYVNETAPGPGYDVMLECVDRQGLSLEIGDDNAVTVANGDAVVCTFTNTAQVDPGCTSTQGYWKTHADSSKKQFDPTWDLLPNGPATTFFLSGQSYLQVMQAATKGNVYYILGQQYIAAVLNGLSGAQVPTEVADAIADATANFFNLYTPTQAAKLSKEARAYWIGVAGLLDSYNNGYEGVPHCE